MDSIEIRPETAETLERYIGHVATILAVALLIFSFYQYLNDLGFQFSTVLTALLVLFVGISRLRNSKPRFEYLMFDDEGIKKPGPADSTELKWDNLESLTYHKSEIAFRFRPHAMKNSISIPWLIRGRTDEIQNALKTYCAEKGVEFSSQL